MSDVYAEFGVNSNSVIAGSGELTDHEKAMIDMPVSVRDGDDLIQMETEQEQEENPLEDEQQQEDSQEDKESNDSEEEEGEESQEETDEEKEPSEESQVDILKAGDEFRQYVAEQEALLEEGIAKGLPADIRDTLKAEYEAGSLSEKSYAELEKAGYSKTFVDSYIRGQEALAERFVQSIYEFSGGKAQFEHVASFMGTHNKDLADTFNDAVTRSDAKAIKAILNTAKAQMTSMFGTKPTRDVTLKAKPVVSTKPVSKFNPFESTSEMVKAMSDKRYQSDAAYRNEVEQRVAISKF